MRLTDERLDYLIRRIAREIIARGIVDGASEESLRPEVRKAFVTFEKKQEEIENKVRHKITSMKRQVAEGSPEWRIIYRQFFEEEMNKL